MQPPKDSGLPATGRMPEMPRGSNRSASAHPCGSGNDAHEHLRRQPSGVRVLPRAMIAVEEREADADLVAGAMRERICLPFQGKGFERRLMCDAAKREDDA